MFKLYKILFLGTILNFSVLSGAHCSLSFPQEKTINKTDQDGLKQGIWVIYNKQGDKILEKGNFTNNLKDGIWTSFFDNGNINHEITFVKGKAKGLAKFYYENGLLRESGNWQIDHWQGEYQYYFESGQLSYDWNYNEKGKREGEQKYFHANGEKMYEGNWNNGKTVGALKVYNEAGILVQEKLFENGAVAEIKKINTDNVISADYNTNLKKDPRDEFKKTGFHTIFTLSGDINKKGFFVKGNLFNGEEFIYSADGTLQKVLIFENGKLKDTIIKKQ
ncbi:toxin-antitoxin system YwqK family antitoxin [Labilibacter sediminis]|nr:toxin-antitoxin system YwqK family antitoxin [Labilibacter sediminis]